MAERRPEREREERDVDQEREPPADGVDEESRRGSGRARTRPDVAAAQIPNARPRCGAVEAWVMSASEPGMSSAPGGALGEPEDDEPFEGRRETAQRGGHGEPDQPDRVDPAPAVVVGQGARQDQQRGQHREVAADDVGLALEDAEERAPAGPGRCA